MALLRSKPSAPGSQGRTSSSERRSGSSEQVAGAARPWTHCCLQTCVLGHLLLSQSPWEVEEPGPLHHCTESDSEGERGGACPKSHEDPLSPYPSWRCPSGWTREPGGSSLCSWQRPQHVPLSLELASPSPRCPRAHLLCITTKSSQPPSKEGSITTLPPRGRK